MTLPELAVRRPITALVSLISIFVIGAIAVSRLPLAFLPDNEPRRINAIVDYPGASPKAIERMIIRPLEEVLSTVPGIQRSQSRCSEGSGRIMMWFDWTTDIDLKRTEVRDRIERIMPELPADLERITLSGNWNPRETGETILEARISSGRDLSKDYDLLERKIIKPLERVSGVASVLLDGVNPREIKINLELNALKRHNIDVRQVTNALAANNEDRSLGVIRSDQQRITLRSLGSFKSIDQIRLLPVPGTNLILEDLAEITYKEPPLEEGRHLDGHFAVGITIAKESNANTVEVCDAILEQVERISADPELGGISILIWQNQGEEIKKTIKELEATGLFGAVLACIILFLFLRRLSTTIIAVICIPFSLIVALGIVWAKGNSLNTLTLLGLIVGVGMLVDNAVVVMENIVRYQQKGYGNRVSALLGSREVSVAVIAATLTSVIVFLPVIFSEPSEMNILLRELGMTVCFTLVASLFVSQTLIPLATGWFIKRPHRRPKDRIMTWLQDRYERVLDFTLNHRWLTLLVGILVLASIIIPYRSVDIILDTDETDLFVGMRYAFSEDLPFEKKQEIVRRVENVLAEHQERFNADSIYSYWSDRFTTTRLYFDNKYSHEKHLNMVRREIRPLLPQIAGVRLEVMDNRPFWRRNSGKRVGFRLSGPDSEVLARIAEEAKMRLETVPGLFDHYSSAEGGTSELHTRIDRQRAREYNIDPGQSSQVVSLTFRGQRLPRFKENGREVDMRLTLEEQENETLDQLKNLQILRDEGGGVPLESFADFAIVKGPDNINRSDKTTNVWVGARYDKGDRAEYIAAARAAFDGMSLPYGYRWEFQAFRRDQEATQREFLTNLFLALGLIFAVMAGLFESIRQAVSLTISLPFALVGAVWGLYLTGTDFDVPAFVGLLLLLGIVVNNGIIMIEHINMYRREGMARRQAMLRGGRERLRPILMTALTTLVGLVPMAVSKPSLGNVYYYSIAIVIMGGLLVSSILTSLLLPSTVCITEDVLGWIGKTISRVFRFLTKPFRRRQPATA